MSLEQQLIRGAYKATGADTQGIVARAQNKMLDDISKAAVSVAEEKEKLEKDKQTLVQSYEKDFERIEKKYINDAGLPIEAWEKATETAEEIKRRYNSYPIGKEGDMQRRKEIAKIKDLANQWESLDDAVDTQVRISGKIKSGDHPEHSNYHKKSMAGIDAMSIRAGMQPQNYSYTSEPGFEIPGQGFVSAGKINDLMVYKADDVGLHMLNRTQANKKSEYKDWNKENSIKANKNAINPKNITSIYYDDIIGNESLMDELKTHSIFKGKDGKGAKYSDLGIELPKDKNGKAIGNQDDIIDENEIEAVIDALADPANPYYDFDTSRNIAVLRMTDMESKMMDTYNSSIETDTPTETDETETGETKIPNESKKHFDKI